MRSNFLMAPAAALIAATRTRPLGALLLLVLALTGWRILVLWTSGWGLVFDEAQYWIWAQDLAWGYYSKPPLIAGLIDAATNLCGNGEGCIRTASPLLHSATAVLTGLIASHLWGKQALWWAGALYATATGVGFSSLLMTTDAPLLLFWAIALYAVVRLHEGGSGAWWLAAGFAIGLGTMSKYAMLYFPLCLALWLAFSPDARGAIRPAGRWPATGGIVAAVIIAPNILWNLHNDLISFRHTAHHVSFALADGALLKGLVAAVGRALGFLMAQLAIAGPVVFGLFAWLLINRRASWHEPKQRMLLFLSMPVLVLMLAQALIAKAFANWAAPAHIAVMLLVTGWLVQQRAWRIGATALALNLAALVGLYHYDTLVRPLVGWTGVDPFARFRGWPALGARVGKIVASRPGAVLVLGERNLYSLFTYYTKPRALAQIKWNPWGERRDDFDRATSIHDFSGSSPLLFVMKRSGLAFASRHFCHMSRPQRVTMARTAGQKRALYAAWATGFRGYDLDRLRDCPKPQ